MFTITVLRGKQEPVIKASRDAKLNHPTRTTGAIVSSLNDWTHRAGRKSPEGTTGLPTVSTVNHQGPWDYSIPIAPGRTQW